MVCVYASENARSRKGREMTKFWNDVNKCLIEIGTVNRIILIGGMNGMVENNEIAGVVGK